MKNINYILCVLTLCSSSIFAADQKTFKEKVLAVFGAQPIPKAQVTVPVPSSSVPQTTIQLATSSEDAVKVIAEQETKRQEIASKERLDLEHERNKWFNVMVQYNAESMVALLALHHNTLKNLQDDHQAVLKGFLIEHHSMLKSLETQRAQAQLEQERIRQKTELAKKRIDQENLPQMLEHDIKTRDQKHAHMMEKLSHIGNGVMVFTQDKQRLMQTAGALSLLALGIYASKRGTRVVADYASAQLMKPALVTETSRISLSDVVNPFSPRWRKKEELPACIYNDELQQQVNAYVTSIKMGKQDNQPFRHGLFYGDPGTGKTLLAKQIALLLGMNYAIIPGSNIHQFGKDAVQELNKLFAWAKSSKKGTVLFFDEVDALTPNRMGNIEISELTRKIQNCFYAHTGTETNEFLLLGATNTPGLLDPAFLSRMEERLEFSLPDQKARKALLEQYFDKYVKGVTSVVMNDNVAAMHESLSEQIKGFSGREISQLARACTAAAYSKADKIVDPNLVNQVTLQRIRQREQLVKQV